MEIKVTSLVQYNGYLGPIVGSIAELGENACQLIWENAREHAKRNPGPLKTEEEFQAMRDHMKGYGAWDAEEIAAWSHDELNALLAQDVHNTMREIPDDIDFDSPSEITEDQWTEATKQVGGRLFPSGNDWYFCLGE